MKLDMPGEFSNKVLQKCLTTTKSALNDRLQIVQERLPDTPVIAITYFVPDERKSGGAYCTEMGIIKKIDYYERTVIMRSGTHIPIDEIIGIEGDLFNQLDGNMI